MTGTKATLVDKLLADIRCGRATRCYESSSLRADIDSGALDDGQIKDAFATSARDCPFESGFGIQRPCSCPFCDAC